MVFQLSFCTTVVNYIGAVMSLTSWYKAWFVKTLNLTVVPQLNQRTTKGIACPDFREAVIIPFLNFWFFCFKTKEQRNETIFFFSFFACTPLAKFKPVSGAGDKKQKKDIRKGLHPLSKV